MAARTDEELIVTPPDNAIFYLQVRTGIFANFDSGVTDDQESLTLSATTGPVKLELRIVCRYRRVVKEDILSYDTEDPIEFDIVD